MAEFWNPTGASWGDIGKALGLSGEDAERWYRATIAHQEEFVPDFHDASRARAVLESGTP